MKKSSLMGFSRKIILGAVLLITSFQSLGASIILGIADSNIGSTVNDQFFTNLFSSDDVFGRISGSSWTLDNWSSRISANGGTFTSGALAAPALVGKEWVATSTNTVWSASELTILSSFVANGGNVVVIGEGPVYSTINNNANAILSSLGSSMLFNVDGTQSSGSVTISSDPIMSGVTSFSGGYIGGITGGTSLVTFSEPSPGQVAVAYDTVGPASAVPIPAAAWLFGSGLLGLAGIARRKKA